jgi:hypothetical protein
MSKAIPFNVACREHLRIHPQHARRLIKSGKLALKPFSLFEGGRRKFVTEADLEAVTAASARKVGANGTTP